MHCEEYTHTYGPAAIKFCHAIGLNLEPWQQKILDVSLAYDPHTKLFKHSTACYLVPRQSGKSYVITGRVLFGAVVLGEDWLVTSLQLPSCKILMYRMLGILLDRRVASTVLRGYTVKPSRKPGEYSITITHPKRGKAEPKVSTIEFQARQGNTGRGKTIIGNVCYDEAQTIDPDATDSVEHTTTTAYNTQIFATGTVPPKHNSHAEWWTPSVRRLGTAARGSPGWSGVCPATICPRRSWATR